MPIRDIIREWLPGSLLRMIRAYRVKRVEKQYQNLTNEQIFTKIYKEKAWGYPDNSGQQFSSGIGSHKREIVEGYKEAVQQFLASLPLRPDVVDLGCGDFHIGSSIRKSCGNYVACDIVPDLIDFNRGKYKDLDVDFRVLDLSRDALPAGEVVFVRQVLQHISNRDIQSVIPKIIAAYKYLVLTEHLPDSDDFVPNRDKAVGPGIRLTSGSGIVLTAEPFNLKPKTERVLCEIPVYGQSSGRVRTTLYELS